MTIYDAAVFTQDTRGRGGSPGGVSVRDLGERVGVSHQTGARVLSTLRRLEYLERASARDRELATVYPLRLPMCVKSDTPPQGEGTPSKGVSRFDTSPTSAVYRHDAFIAMFGRRHMPKSTALVLMAAVEGHTTARAIAEVTGFSAGTVRKALHILESAALVVYDSLRTRTVSLSFTDLHGALDRWARWSGAAGNAECLRLVHELDRERFAETRRTWTRRGQGCP
jgi:DNA-binding MarR family transcriptional regulator